MIEKSITYGKNKLSSPITIISTKGSMFYQDKISLLIVYVTYANVVWVHQSKERSSEDIWTQRRILNQYITGK